MKLSELTTDQAADVLCELTPYIANITGDKSLLDELGKKFDSKGKSVAELYTYAAKKCAVLAPLLLKDHRADVFGILSVLNDTTAEAVAKQNVLTCLIFSDRLGRGTGQRNSGPVVCPKNGRESIAFRLTCPAEKANARKNVSGLCHRRAEIHYRKHSKICRRKLHEDPIS